MIRFLFCAVLLIPSISFAQATLAGVVRDSSNAVLPGVTVETSSPALIEKTRTATTDGTGQYQIVDLRPGTYAITFSLSGFRTIRREGVEISGAGVTTIDVELSLGGLAETLTVRGETPVVDVQSARRQAVLADTVVSQLPAARTYGAILAAIPTLQGAGANPALDTNTNFFFTVHGGPANEGRVQLAGLGVGTAMNGNATSNAIDTANAQRSRFRSRVRSGKPRSEDRFSTSFRPPAAMRSMGRRSGPARVRGRRRIISIVSSERPASRSRRR